MSSKQTFTSTPLRLNSHEAEEYPLYRSPIIIFNSFRMEDDVPYREGIVTRVSSGSAWLNVGLRDEIKIEPPTELKQGVRVTVNMTEKCIVGHDTPRKKDGLYWGYTTRVAKSLSDVIALCPFEKG